MILNEHPFSPLFLFLGILLSYGYLQFSWLFILVIQYFYNSETLNP